MNKPKISIVTPSFNQGQFIEDAIQSVLNQGYNNFEHIIIDACSTDITIEVLKKYQHLIWVSEPDEGQSDAINKGIIKATGEWILWLNADDYMLEGSFEKYLNATRNNPQNDVFYGHTLFVNENKEIRSKCYHIPYLYNYTYFGVYSLPSTGTLFKASLLQANLIDKDFHVVMDTEWVLRCGRFIKPKLVNEFMVAFRVSDFNKTGENIKTGFVSEKHRLERERNMDKYVYKNNSANLLFKMYYKLGNLFYLYLKKISKAIQLVKYKTKFFITK